MIIVSLLGTDPYEAISKTKVLHEGLCKVYGIKDEELEFFAPQSFIIHDGMEQTSYHLNVRVEAPYTEQDKEEEAVSFLKDAFKDMAVHLRILFTYFDPEHEHVLLDPDYPPYMSEKNVVKAEQHPEDEDEWTQEEEYEEPYMGDIIGEFDRYMKEHPDASDKEVYDALTQIRTDVTNKHHEEKKDQKKN